MFINLFLSSFILSAFCRSAILRHQQKCRNALLLTATTRRRNGAANVTRPHVAQENVKQETGRDTSPASILLQKMLAKFKIGLASSISINTRKPPLNTSYKCWSGNGKKKRPINTTFLPFAFLGIAFFPFLSSTITRHHTRFSVLFLDCLFYYLYMQGQREERFYTCCYSCQSSILV